MNPNEHLDQLFSKARKHRDELPTDFGFETRLLAAMREARAPKTVFGVLVWRMLPVFAAITLFAAVYNEKATLNTDLTGHYLGEDALAEILTN